MTDKKIRMPTSENPENHGHTIVGGRPQAQKSMRSNIPRGLELLIKRASVDPEFKTALVQKRIKLLNELGICLDETEKSILECVPSDHLTRMIDATEVPPAQRKAISSGSVAAMLALFTQLAFAPVPGRGETPSPAPTNSEISDNMSDERLNVMVTGIRPDEESSKYDDYEDHLADRGARPDFPGNFIENVPTPESTPVKQVNIDILDNPPAALKIMTSRNTKGMSLKEALELLSDNSALSITYTGLDEVFADYPLESDTTEKSVAETLKIICSEAAGENYSFSCIYDENAKAIQFNFKSALNIEPKPLIKPGNNGSAICRGIRSDMPDLKPFQKEKDIK